jgi:signal transduction histidine kinase
MISGAQSPQGGARYLPWAFALIVAGFALSNIVSIVEMRKTQAEVNQIARHAFNGIDLASILSRYLQKKQLLLQSHIAENKPEEWKPIEDQLAIVDVRIDDAVRAYQPIAEEEGQSEELGDLKQMIDSLEPEVRRILGLSRENLDVEARASAIETVDRDLEAITAATDSLVRFERGRAEREIEVIRTLQRRAVILLATLTIVGTTLALLTAAWVTRLIRQRDEQMREATALLEIRNRELDAFSGRVAHDLRGPLTSISLAAVLLEKHPTAAPLASSVLHDGVKHMTTIIDDLLALSRLSAEPSQATCETTRVAASVEDDLRSKVEAAGGRLRMEIAHATLSCSEGLLRQVLWNLGDNAVKYRRPDAPLEIAIVGHTIHQRFRIVVSDNGSGMAPNDVHQAFEPFFRGKQARATPGSGLGLSIVKRVIEANHGSISVESIPGKGTTFQIELPVAITKAA